MVNRYEENHIQGQGGNGDNSLVHISTIHCCTAGITSSNSKLE